MQPVHTFVFALLVVSNVIAAEAPPSSTSVAPRAQTQSHAERVPDSARRPRNERAEEREPTEQETLALAALEGLMSQPPERALPILKKVLAGSQSTLVKRRALFVLSQ